MKRLGIGLGLWMLWSGAGEAAQQTPESGDGRSGIRVTVAQLLAAEQSAAPKAERRLLPKRRLPAGSKAGAPVRQATQAAALKAGPSQGPLTPQVAGTLFNGDSAPATIVTPPASLGAAGPTQFLVCTNSRIRIFSKGGVLGSFDVTLDTFFGPVLGGARSTDPRVRFDGNTGGWFIPAISDDAGNNRIM